MKTQVLFQPVYLTELSINLCQTEISLSKILKLVGVSQNLRGISNIDGDFHNLWGISNIDGDFQ